MSLCSISSLRCRFTLIFACLFLTITSYFMMNIFTMKQIKVPPPDTKIQKISVRFQSSCREQRNFVFIKQMKCATSTLVSAFYRFGYKRNLSFVSPIKFHLNWPYRLTKFDLRPSSSGYNILTDHAIYTQDVMESIMPQDTVYLSIIRHPFSHVMSVFQYFKVGELSGVPHTVENRFEEYLRHIEQYDAKYKQAKLKSRFCVPENFSLTKNLMSHCLGVPLGFPAGVPDVSGDPNGIDSHIRHIDKKFTLVMIVEYLYESLVLLRRLMCWNFSDIVFLTSNVGRYSFRRKNISNHLHHVHQNWSSVDYRLYDYFNKTFWMKVSQQGSDFFQELSFFKSIQQNTEKYCRAIHEMGYRPWYRYPWYVHNLTVAATPWSDEFVITTEDCWLLGPDPYRVMKAVQEENTFKEAALLKQRATVADTRKHKGIC